MKPSCDTSLDMDTPIRDCDVHGVGLSGLIKNDLLRDTLNDQSIPNDTIKDRIATATYNVSMVILKCIDPKLQPLKKNLEASTSPKANQGDDIMIQESSANDLVQEKLGMDFDGMQIEDGGEPSVSD